MDAVVAHVTHAAQHHALRKAVRTLVVASPQLPKHGDQRVSDQGIDLVDQQYERCRIGLAPPSQRLAQGALSEDCQDVGPSLVQEPVTQRARPRAQLAQNDAHGPQYVPPGRLSRLDIDIDAAEIPPDSAVQKVSQSEQSGGLARLPRRMQHEVPLVADEFQDLGEIHPLQRRDTVVVLRDHGTFGVESAHGSEVWHLGRPNCADSMSASPINQQPNMCASIGSDLPPPAETSRTECRNGTHIGTISYTERDKIPSRRTPAVSYAVRTIGFGASNLHNVQPISGLSEPGDQRGTSTSTTTPCHRLQRSLPNATYPP